jgi:non-ribosomal peptide synthetase component F
MSVRKNIAGHFFDRYVEAPANQALFVEDAFCSYGELAARARAVAGWIEALALAPGARVALVASGTSEGYGALLGCAWAGVTYVPLSPWFPPDYVRKLLERAGADVVIADANGRAALSAIEGWRPGPHFLDLSGGFGQLDEYLHLAPSEPVPLPPHAIVHIMFSSGSTGEPKMIGATLANIDAYLTTSQERYAFTAADRVSHYNELGWDPYLLDLFGAWDVGACTFAVPKGERLAPAGFIHRHALTTWF